MGRKSDFGESWWARRWIEVLESFGWASRLQRGRSYARAGNVLELKIGSGNVLARVQGSRPKPYRVSINLDPLSSKDWDRVTEAMAAQAVFAAKLLAGEMPAEIEEAFRVSGVPLFPRSARDLRTDCSCPDWANPCKHVAAVCYLLGREFDADPFLLFRLRGREREQVLADLRARRAKALQGSESTEAMAPNPNSKSDMTMTALYPSDSDTATSLDRFWTVGDSASQVQVRITAPGVTGAILRRLGAPDLPDGEGVLAKLRNYYRIITEQALTLGLERRTGEVQDAVQKTSEIQETNANK